MAASENGSVKMKKFTAINESTRRRPSTAGPPRLLILCSVIILVPCFPAQVESFGPMGTRRHKRRATGSCWTDMPTVKQASEEDKTEPMMPSPSPAPSPVVRMDRKGMLSATLGLASATARAMGGVSAADATDAASLSWMAAPDKALVPSHRQGLTEAEFAMSQVTAENIRQYNTDGVTVVRNVVPHRWIDALRRGCEVAQDEAGPYAEYLQQATDAGIFFTDLELSRRLPVFSAFCQYSPVAAVAGIIMGTKSIRYLYDQLFVKEKGVSTTTPWHQDGGYWRVHGMQIGSAFVPLDSVSEGDGLYFVTGSQRWKLHNPQHFADGTPYKGTSLPPMPDIDLMVQSNEANLQTFALQPGDVLLFSARTVHGGPGNWGRALSTRWVGDDAAFWARPGEGAVPTGDVGLKDGEPLAHNGNAFPEIWNGLPKHFVA